MVPCGDETCSANDLRSPEYSVCQTDAFHVDCAGDAGDGGDPKDGCRAQLNRAGEKSDFLPSAPPPDPFLWFKIPVVMLFRLFAAVKSMSTHCIETMDSVSEANLPLPAGSSKNDVPLVGDSTIQGA